MKRKIVLMTSVLMAIGLLAGCAHSHEWETVTYSWSDDNKTCTATRVCKGDESHKETETANSTYAVVAEAKCEEKGKGKFTVTFKNEAFGTQSKEVEIDAIGHAWAAATYTWSEDNLQCTAKRVCEKDASHVETEKVETKFVVVSPATCELPGVGKYVATFKNAAFIEQTKENIVIEANGHSWGEPTYVWSEESKSFTATRVCASDPSHVETETAVANLVTVTPATCENAGVGKYVASFDNEAFATQTKENINIPKLGHDYKFDSFVWSEKWDSAKAKYVCSHDSEHVELHDAVVATSTVDPSCETAGKKTFTATYGNHSDVKESTIPAKGHNYGAPTYVWSDDNTKCTATRVCANDPSHTETETVDSAYSETTAATCESAGAGKYVATFKNTAFAEQNKEIVIDALDHDYQFDSFVWDDKWENAQAKYVCSRNAEHVELHDAVVNANTVNPTCETAGKKTFTATYDNHIDVKESTIPAKGHNYGTPTYVWSDDNTKCTATRVCGNDNSHVETETVDTDLKVTLEPTCENDGSGTRFASFNNSAFAIQSKDVVLPAHHLYAFDSFVWNGFECKAKLVCSRNSEHVDYVDIDVTAEITTQPGCLTEGVKTYTATYDGHTDTKTGSVSPKGHKWGTPTYSWSNDYSKCTARRVCENDKTHVDSETVDAVAVITKNPGTEERGTIQFTATFDSVNFATQTIQRVVPMMSLADGDHYVVNMANWAWDEEEFYIPAEIDGKPVTELADEAFWHNMRLSRIYIPASITSIGGGAFDNCFKMNLIVFGGTMAQWNAITKGENWNLMLGTNQAICTDGTVNFGWNLDEFDDDPGWDDDDPDWGDDDI
ncbi:MAG: hypothetical protein SPL80_08295 [Bacilli bacterium]|nr:hypothetical protein [Bacilli bacterium]